MRIILLRANSEWRSVYIPIGLGYLADSVRKAGHEVSILDARLLRMSLDDVVGYVRELSPDVVGLSAVHLDFDIQGTRELAGVLKRFSKKELECWKLE